MGDNKGHTTMKRIFKRESPQYFEAWKENFKKENGVDATYADFRFTSEWTMLRGHLLEEQGYLCCYCMQRIEDYDSHIEHFVPRSIKKRRPHSIFADCVDLDYTNMFMSCESNDHCGRFKDNDETWMLLSPTEEAIEEQFEYSLNGEIKGISEKAMSTIRATRLDALSLTRHRASAIHLAMQEEDPESFIVACSERDAIGQYMPFCVAMKYCLEKFGSSSV